MKVDMDMVDFLYRREIKLQGGIHKINMKDGIWGKYCQQLALRYIELFTDGMRHNSPQYDNMRHHACMVAEAVAHKIVYVRADGGEVIYG